MPIDRVLVVAALVLLVLSAVVNYRQAGEISRAESTIHDVRVASISLAKDLARAYESPPPVVATPEPFPDPAPSSSSDQALKGCMSQGDRLAEELRVMRATLETCREDRDHRYALYSHNLMIGWGRLLRAYRAEVREFLEAGGTCDPPRREEGIPMHAAIVGEPRPGSIGDRSR